MLAVSKPRAQLMISLAGAILMAACSDEAPIEPESSYELPAQFATLPKERREAIAILRRVTAAYQDIDAAIADGFVLLHPCEDRPGEGPVGIVYVHMGRLLDGVIDLKSPDALIYNPGTGAKPELFGVEFAITYGMWTAPQPPQFLGAQFQREDEFGVWAMHAWVWRDNPEGLFAESHPRVTCSVEE